MKIFSVNKLREGFKKTSSFLSERFSNIFSKNKNFSEENVDEIFEVLLLSDFGYSFSKKIIEEAKKYLKQNKSEYSFQEVVKNKIQNSLIKNEAEENINATPLVIMIVGINGVGKTTTVAKLANIFLQKKKKVLIASADTFRAAANEQLAIWAGRLNVEIISQKQGADSSAVAFDTVQSAIAKKIDVVLIDTAGRLHTKTNLMEELAKMKRVLKKLIPDAPHEILFVLDGSTGQNGIQQALTFNNTLNLTGLIVTKLDGTAKGGIVVNISDQLQIPVKYIGVGEKIDDLQEFDAIAYTNALFNISEEVKA